MYQKTLVIGVNWMGDAVMSLPALAALQELLKGKGSLHVEAPPFTAPIYEMASLAERVHTWSMGESMWRKIKGIRGQGYTTAVLFPNSIRSAFIAWLGRIPHRWGYATQGRGVLLNRGIPDSLRPRGRHHSEHFLEIVRRMGWKGHETLPVSVRIKEKALRWANRTLAEVDLLRGGPLVGICPGANYGPAKRWDISRFKAVAGHVVREMAGKVMVLGTVQERQAWGPHWKGTGDGVANLMGETDIDKLAALLSMCDVVVANDSGPMHLAAAVGTPVVAIFGSTDPVATAPMGPHVVVKKEMECSPCLKRTCPKGTYECLSSIQIDDVLRALHKALGVDAEGVHGPMGPLQCDRPHPL